MALRQRNVVGILVNGDGQPVQNANVQFKLTAPLAYTDTHVIVDTEFVATTIGTGEFTISLWCDEDSLVAVNYNVQFPKETGGLPDSGHSASFSLEYGAGDDINISELITASIPAPTPEELLYTYIDTVVAAATAEAVGLKIYSAYLNQSGTGDPTDTVIINLFGGGFIWSRISQGTYRAVKTGAFPAGKFFAPIQVTVPNGTNFKKGVLARIDDDTVEMTLPSPSVPADDVLSNIPIFWLVAV